MKFTTTQFFVLVYFSAVSAQRPEIVDEILPEVKPINETAYINCTVINKDPGSTVLWSKARTNLSEAFPISEDEQVTWQGDLGMLKYEITTSADGRRITYMLVIHDLTEGDAGDYICTIRIQGIPYNQFPTKIGKLTVKIAPQIHATGNSTYELQEGDNLNLTCQSSGIPTPNITWRREDGNELPSGGFQARRSLLQLKNIQKDDRGNYICTADNNVPPADTYKVELIVFFQPSCRPVQDTVGQAQNGGFSATLECIVSGSPQPSMRWEILTNQGWKNVINDDKYDIDKLFSSQLQSDETWFTLLIKNVLANDYTRYKCIGNNAFGENSTEFVLFETAQCQGLNCPSVGSGENSTECQGHKCTTNVYGSETTECQGHNCTTNGYGSGTTQCQGPSCDTSAGSSIEISSIVLFCSLLIRKIFSIRNTNQ